MEILMITSSTSIDVCARPMLDECLHIAVANDHQGNIVAPPAALSKDQVILSVQSNHHSRKGIPARHGLEKIQFTIDFQIPLASSHSGPGALFYKIVR